MCRPISSHHFSLKHQINRSTNTSNCKERMMGRASWTSKWLCREWRTRSTALVRLSQKKLHCCKTFVMFLGTVRSISRMMTFQLGYQTFLNNILKTNFQFVQWPELIWEDKKKQLGMKTLKTTKILKMMFNRTIRNWVRKTIKIIDLMAVSEDLYRAKARKRRTRKTKRETKRTRKRRTKTRITKRIMISKSQVKTRRIRIIRTRMRTMRTRSLKWNSSCLRSSPRDWQLSRRRESFPLCFKKTMVTRNRSLNLTCFRSSRPFSKSLKSTFRIVWAPIIVEVLQHQSRKRRASMLRITWNKERLLSRIKERMINQMMYKTRSMRSC